MNPGVSAVDGRSRPTERPEGRFRFLIQPGWVGAIVGALAFTAACWLVLAPWQFGRHAERAAANHAITTAATASPVPVRQLLSTGKEPAAGATYLPVTATGVFDPDHTFYVRLRQDDSGNPVSEVVLPMRLEDGGILLVDRGYRSFADIDAGVPLPPVPGGVVTIIGRVQQDQVDPAHRGATTVTSELVDGHLKPVPPRIEVHAVNADLLSGFAGTVDKPGGTGNALQGYVQLTAASPGVLDEIGMPQTDSGPYLSYALQWCAFGAMSLLAIAYFIFREATDPRGPDERHVPYPERGGSARDSGLQSSGHDGSELGDGQLAVSVQGAAAATEHGSPEVRTPKRRRPARDGFDRSQLFD